MAAKPVKNKSAIVTGDPNSPLGYGMNMRVYTCTYDHTASPNCTLAGVGPLKNGDIVLVDMLQTNAGSGYAGINWDTGTTVYDPNSGTVGLAPVNSAPSADINLLVTIIDL